MADILIRGMELPKNDPLRIVLNPNGQLFVDHGVTFTEYEAIELPEHGDLIDLDAVVNCQYYDDMYEEWSIRTVTVRDVLYGCLEAMPPVVIPSNKEETE